MIKTTKTIKGENKVIFRGSVNTIKKDFIMILWSMIQKEGKTRQAAIDAIEEVNDALKQVHNS